MGIGLSVNDFSVAARGAQKSQGLVFGKEDGSSLTTRKSSIFSWLRSKVKHRSYVGANAAVQRSFLEVLQKGFNQDAAQEALRFAGIGLDGRKSLTARQIGIAIDHAKHNYGQQLLSNLGKGDITGSFPAIGEDRRLLSSINKKLGELSKVKKDFVVSTVRVLLNTPQGIEASPKDLLQKLSAVVDLSAAQDERSQVRGMSYERQYNEAVKSLLSGLSEGSEAKVFDDLLGLKKACDNLYWEHPAARMLATPAERKISTDRGSLLMSFARKAIMEALKDKGSDLMHQRMHASKLLRNMNSEKSAVRKLETVLESMPTSRLAAKERNMRAFLLSFNNALRGELSAAGGSALAPASFQDMQKFIDEGLEEAVSLRFKAVTGGALSVPKTTPQIAALSTLDTLIAKTERAIDSVKSSPFALRALAENRSDTELTKALSEIKGHLDTAALTFLPYEVKKEEIYGKIRQLNAEKLALDAKGDKEATDPDTDKGFDFYLQQKSLQSELRDLNKDFMRASTAYNMSRLKLYNLQKKMVARAETPGLGSRLLGKSSSKSKALLRGAAGIRGVLELSDLNSVFDIPQGSAIRAENGKIRAQFPLSEKLPFSVNDELSRSLDIYIKGSKNREKETPNSAGLTPQIEKDLGRLPIYLDIDGTTTSLSPRSIASASSEEKTAYATFRLNDLTKGDKIAALHLSRFATQDSILSITQALRKSKLSGLGGAVQKEVSAMDLYRIMRGNKENVLITRGSDGSYFIDCSLTAKTAPVLDSELNSVFGSLERTIDLPSYEYSYRLKVTAEDIKNDSFSIDSPLSVREVKDVDKNE